MHNDNSKVKIDGKKSHGTKKTNRSIEELKNQAEEYKSNYLRALADYQNLERRVRDEREQVAVAAKANFVTRLLPFIDNLEKAEAFISDPGLKMIKDQFLGTLKEAGVKEVDVLDKEFDPRLAEAIEVIPGSRDNVVCEIVRKGYIMNGIVLQTAQVKVTKKS